MSEEKKDTQSSPQSSLEDRIAALVGQRNDARDASADLQRQNSELATKLQQLESQIAAFASRPENPPPQFDVNQREPVQSKPGPLDATTLTQVVKQTVDEALRPVREQLTATSEESRLSKAHQASFARAVQQHPELKNPESELTRVAGTLWQGRQDLAKLEDAPEVFAAMARGVLADQRADDKAKESAKRQAAIPQTPASPAMELLKSDHQKAKQDLKSMRDEILSKPVGGGMGGAEAFSSLFRSSLTEAAINKREEED